MSYYKFIFCDFTSNMDNLRACDNSHLSCRACKLLQFYLIPLYNPVLNSVGHEMNYCRVYNHDLDQSTSLHKMICLLNFHLIKDKHYMWILFESCIYFVHIFYFHLIENQFVRGKSLGTYRLICTELSDHNLMFAWTSQ